MQRFVGNKSMFVSQGKYRLVIVGAGSGGVSQCFKLRKYGKVAICDGAKYHYYQPSWTLCAANLCRFENSRRILEHCLPKDVDFFNLNASQFHPKDNKIVLEDGKEIFYDCLIVATGLHMNTKPVQGMEEALNEDSRVFTIYEPKYVQKAYRAICEFDRSGGSGFFTYPATETFKCRGAAAKITFLTSSLMHKNPQKSINFVTPFDYLFSVPYYNEALMRLAKQKSIKILRHQTLTRIDHRTSTLELLSKDNVKKEVKYDLVHYTPDMVSVPEVALSSICDANGFVNVDKYTLQHVDYPNIFSIGDCSNLPTSKTLAAVSAQAKVLSENVRSFLEGKLLNAKYDGYTACPLTTSLKTVVLAEFDYEKKPLETFPFDQRKESRIILFFKKWIFPRIYWTLFCRGRWNGPHRMRRFFKILKIQR